MQLSPAKALHLRVRPAAVPAVPAGDAVDRTQSDGLTSVPLAEPWCLTTLLVKPPVFEICATEDPFAKMLARSRCPSYALSIRDVSFRE